MDFEDLTEDLKDKYRMLKHGSATIQADVEDALEDAENIEDFREKVRDKMKALIYECKDVSSQFYDEYKPERMQKDQLRETLDDLMKCLESIDCQFKMCDGPDAPFVAMKTCHRCYAVQQLRSMINML